MENFDRYRDGCTSTPERRIKGETIRNLILARPRNTGILSVFRPPLFFPFGFNTFHSFRFIHSSALSETFIRVRSPRSIHNQERKAPYEIVVPNVWPGIDAKDFRLFQRAASDDKLFAKCLSEELGVPVMWTFDQLVESLEAILPLRFPLGLVRIFNFIDRAAQPTSVDLSPTAVLEEPPKVVRKPKGRYPVSRRIVKSRVRRRRSGGKAQLWVPSEMDLARTNSSDRTVAKLCLAYLEAIPLPGTKRRKLLSEERYLYAFPFAHESLTSGKRLSYVGSIEAEAIRIVARMEGRSAAEIVPLVRQDPPRVRRLPLLSPTVIEKRYGLDRPFPSLTDTIGCALRVITLILFHAGRRARCLMNVRLGDFVVLGDACDLRIPDTKVATVASQSIPLSALFPDADLLFLLSWLRLLRTLGTSEDTFLLDLAGIFRSSEMESDVAWGQMATKLSRALEDRKGTISTHIPRHYFMTWLPIRRLLVHYRWLLNHPLLRDCLGHPWFQPQNLDKLKKLFPSPVTGLMSVLPKIVGHSLGTESRRSYMRASCIEIALQAAILEHPNCFGPSPK